MNIPEEAIKAGAKATYEAGPGYELTGHKPWEELSNTSRANATRNATAALTAALPHIRKQIAADIRAEMNQPRLIELADRHEGYYQGQRTGLERAARIAEEGTLK